MLGVCFVWPLMEVQFLVLWHVWIFQPWRLVLSPVQALSRDSVRYLLSCSLPGSLNLPTNTVHIRAPK